jgi:hypothetical protein
MIQSYIEELVNNGFNELNDLKITSSYMDSFDAYAEYSMIGREEYHISLDKKLEKAKPEVIKGVLAHELAHILDDECLGTLASDLRDIMYFFNPKIRTYIERKTDMAVLKRGYGPELLAFVKYHDKRRKKYTFEDGLTKKEIKKLLPLFS